MEISSENIKIVKRKNAKKITITVKSSGKVTVTAPPWTPRYLINSFVKDKDTWIKTQLDNFEKSPGSLLLKGSNKDYSEFKQEAWELASDRINYFNKHYKFKFNNIKIKNQSTLWGSCSSKGNLNFNYRIVFLPPAFRDYIIVHELCHLKEMNHSTNFWKLVEETVPDYKDIRKKLKSLK